MSRSGSSVLLTLFVTACAQPVPQAPQPQALASPLAPSAVVQRAAALLVVDGFEITTSDANAGVLVAKRVREGTGNQPRIKCRWLSGSTGEQNLESTMTVNLSARPAAEGSAITIASRVVSAYPRLERTVMRLAPNEQDCASTGSVEEQLATALRAP